MERCNYPSRFGAVIAAKRRKMGISTQQLADQIGIDSLDLQKIEEEPLPSLDGNTIQLLADALCLNCDYIKRLLESDESGEEPEILMIHRKPLTAVEKRMMLTAFDVAFASNDDGLDNLDDLI